MGEWALYPSNAEKVTVYRDNRNKMLGEIKYRKVKRKKAATLSDLYPSTCLTSTLQSV